MRPLAEIEFDEIGIGLAVNLRTLREVLRGLSVGGKRWWIACDPVDVVNTHVLTIGHGDPGCVDRLNTLYFNVPVLNDVKPLAGTGSLALLLDASVISAIEPGLYLEDGRILQDPFADMECFFQPIREALINMLHQE
jgi:hypothetical protein